MIGTNMPLTHFNEQPPGAPREYKKNGFRLYTDSILPIVFAVMMNQVS